MRETETIGRETMTKRKIKPEIELYVYEGVNKDGTFKNGEAGAHDPYICRGTH
jgi:hypothetical protein